MCTSRLIILILSLVACGLSTAQTGTDHSQHTNLPVLVDGSKTPDGISDEIAYRHFIMSAAEHQTLSKVELDRRAMLLSRMALSPLDAQAMIGALTGVREQLDRLDWTELQPLVNSAVRQSAHIQILDAALSRVRAALSVDGLKRVDQYVQGHVKPRIKIVGTK